MDGIDVLLALLRDLFGAGFDQIFQQQQGLVHVAPVLAVIVRSLPDHLHNLRKGHHVVRQVGDLRHDRGGRSPWIVGGRLAYLDLCIGIVVGKVLDVPAYASNVHLRVVSFHRGLMIAAGGYPKRDDAGSSTISETLCVNNINSYRRGRLDELRDVCVIAYVAKGGVVVVVAAIAGALRE